MIGCPIHLCWWPVLDDLFYHEGIYYLFQGRWMWTFKEGAAHFYYSLPATHAIDLRTTAGIDFPVYGAYYDYNLKKVMIVRSDRTGSGLHFIEELNITVDQEGMTLTATYIRSSKVQLFAKTTDVVLSATMIETGGDGGGGGEGDDQKGMAENRPLWVVFEKKGGLIVLMSFKLSSPDNGQTMIYQKISRNTNFLFPGISAFFYHSGFGHLFLLTGYFLYVFKEAAFDRLETGRCSVFEFAYFFNCSGYFDAELMNGRAKGVLVETKKRLQVFTTAEQFSKDAKRFHRGSMFLPGQCNFLSSLPHFGAIPFSAKVKTADDVYGDGPTSDGLNFFLASGLAAVVVLGVAIFLVTCLLCTSARGRARRLQKLDSLAKHRQRQELKLKQYLRKELSRSSPFGKGSGKSRRAGVTGSSSKGTRTPSSMSGGSVVSSSSPGSPHMASSKSKSPKLRRPLSQVKLKTKHKRAPRSKEKTSKSP